MSVDHTDHAPLDAGEFGAWMIEITAAIAGLRPSDVPCGTCTACCTSSQFVHIEPDETDTLAHIPAELLFPAPMMPPGHVLMGYDQRGHCPMLGEAGCTIYEHRPRTCRTYDCRVFAAAGVEQIDPGKDGIRRRASRWVFTYADDQAHRQHDAVRARAAHLAATSSPPNATALAVRAVETGSI
jgi:hypothetical protein